MLPLSHFSIAKALYKSFLESLNIELDLKSFVYGCIKPDFAPSLIKISHYKNKSFDTICNRISLLEREPFPKTKKDLKKFSMELGIVAHYLADYFCYPHNNKKYNFTPIHFIYENRLAYVLRKIDIEELSYTFLVFAEDSFINTTEDLINFINRKHMDYLNKDGKVFKDIEFSVEICAVVLYNILKKNAAHFS
ncbi:zinc dependent phospholipase C family protein [Clostridium sp.]|uniref:zinc dependent phospholipase C family protein n=1 Tax=Clostridium sp. TaxID=1506 RepID=UPI0039F63A17